MACENVFINSATSGLEDVEANRTMIRRHVMLGKNKGKKRPRTQAKLRALEDLAVNGEARDNGPRVPARVGTDLSFIDFADTVQLSFIGDILKFSAVAKQTFFPLEPCIAFDRRKKFLHSFQPLTFDPLYLHAMVFCTQSWFCVGASRSVDKRVLYHLVKAIGLLRKRLDLATGDSDAERVSEPTLNAIIMLAGQALLMGDEVTSRKHVIGMERAITLRGGLESLTGNTKLLLEALRCDISLALCTGSPPVLQEACVKETWFRLPSMGPLFQSPAVLPESTDIELQGIWTILQQFTTLINNATSTSHRYPEELILETMAGAMYRLLSMDTTKALDQALRRGLLAFCSHIFLPWTSVKLPFGSLHTTYLKAVRRLREANPTSTMMLWLLAMGNLVLFTGSREDYYMRLWLRESIEAEGFSSWSDMREKLKGYLWIDIVFDRASEDMWNSLMDSHV